MENNVILKVQQKSFQSSKPYPSWVIWSTSVTVESEGSFLSVFVFFEGH